MEIRNCCSCASNSQLKNSFFPRKSQWIFAYTIIFIWNWSIAHCNWFKLQSAWKEEWKMLILFSHIKVFIGALSSRHKTATRRCQLSTGGCNLAVWLYRMLFISYVQQIDFFCCPLPFVCDCSRFFMLHHISTWLLHFSLMAVFCLLLHKCNNAWISGNSYLLLYRLSIFVFNSVYIFIWCYSDELCTLFTILFLFG